MLLHSYIDPERGFFSIQGTWPQLPLEWGSQTFTTVTWCVWWLSQTCVLSTAYLCNPVISAKPFDLRIPLFVVRIFSFLLHVSLVHSFSWLSFDVDPRPFVSLNFWSSSYPSTWAVSNFLWLISESKSDLIAFNAILSVVKIFSHVILIQLATPRTAWSRNVTSVFHCLCILLFCASHFFHLPAIILSVFVIPSLSFFLLCTHCSCRWL